MANQNPTHIYTGHGVYTVSLTVSNDGGTTTETYERVIPVGNTGVVGFNINPLDDAESQFINWTTAFKNFEYVVGDTLAIPVMWKTTPGTSAVFNSMPTTVCDDDEDTSNQQCVIFTPEEASGTAPAVVGAAQDGVLFTMTFDEVQFRGATDIFKGKANVRVVVDVDTDGDNIPDQTNQLGTNVDVTNSGTETDELRKVAIFSPFEGEFVGGTETISAGVVSSLTADQVEFFLNGTESLGVDTDGSDGWLTEWDTTTLADGPYQLTAVATFAGTETTTSSVRNVTVENAAPTEPSAPEGTFQTGRTNDTLNKYTYPFELEEEGGGGPPGGRQPSFESSMTAEISNIAVHVGGVDPDDGVIGGDAIEFDVTLDNTSSDPDAVMTAFAFQSKFSESPALASRIGDKAFYGQLAGGGEEGKMSSVKKNGTSNGLFGGRWKGICINSSIDYLPEFNAGLEEESLECGGNRADLDADGEPELQSPVMGIYPGDSQTVRVRIEAGTTDGALHTAPMFPYDTLCVYPAVPDGLRCGARPFTPVAEFYKDNGDGSLTQQMVGGSYGELGSADQYTASFDVTEGEDWKEETTPEEDPGGPCDPIADPDNRRPSCAQLRTSSTGHFYDLDVSPGAGINGGDVVEFTMDITNTSTNPNAYLTAFNYQTKQRSLADIGELDGYSQDRRDIRVAGAFDATTNPTVLPLCTSLDDGACWNAALGIGQFPNVIGNGLLFGQMVWPNNIDREGKEIIFDFVHVDPDNGIAPEPFKLESVKKNGPFTPILKGNVSFICVKSGLFAVDQDSDAACAGEPAILIDEDGEPVPGNVSQRLGLAPMRPSRCGFARSSATSEAPCSRSSRGP